MRPITALDYPESASILLQPQYPIQYIRFQASGSKTIGSRAFLSRFGFGDTGLATRIAVENPVAIHLGGHI